MSIKKFFNFFFHSSLAYFFIGIAPLMVVFTFINRDSLFYMAVTLAIFIIITALFFFCSSFSKKGKIITLCLAGIMVPMYFVAFMADEYPSFTVMDAVRDRFPDIKEWDIRYDNNAHKGMYTGTYIYYDMDRKKFKYDGISKENVKDISVIAFYSYSEPRKVGIYRDEKTGKKRADAMVSDIKVMLVDADTKTCFAEKSFRPTPPETLSDTRSAYEILGYNSPIVQSFIRTFFSKTNAPAVR